MSTESKPTFRRIRRSASQTNLESRHKGKNGEMLENALRTPSQGREGYSLTHGLHPYPARFHPNLPRMILRWLGQQEGTQSPRLLDPFMGGGTLLVEGLCRGWETTGNDINPIATLVARERCRARLPKHAAIVWACLEYLHEEVDKLRIAKTRIQRQHLPFLRTYHQPHIFVEMLQWMECIERLPPAPERDTVRFVFSSLTGKFSKRAHESTAEGEQKGDFPKGAFSMWMQKKTREVLQRQQELSRKVPDPRLRPQLWQQDARELHLKEDDQPFDCLITSPPYPGTYDYYEHHRLRLKWLNLPIEQIANNEIGTKRQHSAAAWKETFRTCLLRMRQVTANNGHCFLVIGDWTDHGRKADGLEFVEKYADSVGWLVQGSASVRRPIYDEHLKEQFGETGRWEHLLWLQNKVRSAPPA